MDPVSPTCIPIPTNENIKKTLSSLGVIFKERISKMMIKVILPKGWGIVENTTYDEHVKSKKDFQMWIGYLITEKYRAVAFIYWLNCDVEFMSGATIELVNEVKELDMTYMKYEDGWYEFKDTNMLYDLTDRVRTYYDAHKNKFSQEILDMIQGTLFFFFLY